MSTEAKQRKRAANQEAGDKAEQGKERQGEVEGARPGLGESKNGNPVLGLRNITRFVGIEPEGWVPAKAGPPPSERWATAKGGR